MFLIINDNNINLNYIKLYKKKYIYKIFYDTNYFKLIGIPIRLKNFSIIIKNNIYYLYLYNKENVVLLSKIEKYINDTINCKIFNYNYNNLLYIICKNYNKKKINNYYIDINISKKKYINNIYVPIINII